MTPTDPVESQLTPYRQAVEQVVASFRRSIPRTAAVRDALGSAIGEDIDDDTTGERLIEAWTVLRAAHIGALAAFGRETVSIVPRPRVAVLRSGGAPATNDPLVRAACEGTGATVVAQTRIGEDAAAISEWINGVCQICDVVIVTSGAEGSAGEVLVTEGRMRTWTVATEPSLTVSFARVSQTPVLRVDDDPVRAALGSHVFVQRALRVMAGLPAEPLTREGVMEIAVAAPADRTALIPVAIDGRSVRPARDGKSITLRHVMDGSGLAIVPPGGVEAGAEVDVELLD